jgi:hypothetical protein
VMASHMRTSGSIVTGRSRLVGNQKGLLFATEWHFKDLGVQEVKRRFAAGKCGSVSALFFFSSFSFSFVGTIAPLCWRAFIRGAGMSRNLT